MQPIILGIMSIFDNSAHNDLHAVPTWEVVRPLCRETESKGVEVGVAIVANVFDSWYGKSQYKKSTEVQYSTLLYSTITHTSFSILS